MPTTRKKVIKTVYKDDAGSEAEESGDFSDSGSDAKISEPSDCSEDEQDPTLSPDDIEEKKPNKRNKAKRPLVKKTTFAKDLIGRIRMQKEADSDEDIPVAPAFSIKDLTEADKLLPSVLNLSESDSSDDDDERPSTSRYVQNTVLDTTQKDDSDHETPVEYKDVWSKNLNSSNEIAIETFKQLQLHADKVAETKTTLKQYSLKTNKKESNVNDLLAQGEEILEPPILSKIKIRHLKDESESEVEDWEEVKETKALPQQGIQLVVDFPDTNQKKRKALDVEMMMRRKINRVKKEYQIYMHKVHVLCWIGHGNHVSKVLNDQDVMAAALLLVPSKSCYPGERVDVDYVEKIATWYKDKFTFKYDKNEDKFKPKAPPLKEILISQIKTRVATTNKYLVFIFVSMLRALGLQCRVVFNFVTLPLKPPSSELCSLATKHKDANKTGNPEKNINKKTAQSKSQCNKNKKSVTSIPQLDGVFDMSCSSDSDFENIMQVDGNDDTSKRTARTTRNKTNTDKEAISKPTAAPNRTGTKSQNSAKSEIEEASNVEKTTKTRATRTKANTKEKAEMTKPRASPNRTGTKSRNTTKSVTEAINIHEKTTERRAPRTKANIKEEAGILKPRASPNRSTTKSQNTSRTETEADNNDEKPAKTRATRTKANSKKEAAIAKLSASSNRSGSKSSEDNNDNGNKKAQTRATRNNISTDKELIVSKRTRASPIRTQTKTQNKNVAISKTDKKALAISENEDVSPPKISRISSKPAQSNKNADNSKTKTSNRSRNTTPTPQVQNKSNSTLKVESVLKIESSPRKTRGTSKTKDASNTNKNSIPKIIIIDSHNVASKYFNDSKVATAGKSLRLSRKRSHTANNLKSDDTSEPDTKKGKPKSRTKSAPSSSTETSKYFGNQHESSSLPKGRRNCNKDDEDNQRVSHKDLAKSTKKRATNDVTGVLKEIIEKNADNYKAKPTKKTSKIKDYSGSDYLAAEDLASNAESDEDFKPSKINPKIVKRLIDRRVLSPDVQSKNNKTIDVWCEVYVEELEQWIAVDIIKGLVHCTKNVYDKATNPVAYIVGWDNNNHVKDVTRRYVPHWNTITRKLRAEPAWWEESIRPYKPPRNARDKEEDEQLDRLQLEAPLPKTIHEYKNHPLYALKRHLLKFEVIYPPDSSTLGFIRGEAVYSRDCIHVCRSRDTWLKEAKVVKMGEQPYKVVKARPKWDKLSNKMISDLPLEVFGSWQTQDYEPPEAENGIVPRNAYGNVELFKECMLPKGTVHIRLPGLSKVARKLNIDCAPAMTGWDFSGGHTHPVYDGFVVCKEFEHIIKDAYEVELEEQERKEREKIETRVYGNWRRIIKGLFIRERLKDKYGFVDPPPNTKKKTTGPRFVVKKR